MIRQMSFKLPLVLSIVAAVFKESMGVSACALAPSPRMGVERSPRGSPGAGGFPDGCIVCEVQVVGAHDLARKIRDQNVHR